MNELKKGKLDKNFVLFFLNRFEYFLSLIVVHGSGKCPRFSDKCELIDEHKNVIDFLKIPAKYAYRKYEGKESVLLNQIISTSSIRGVVERFICILLKQVEEAAHHSDKQCAEDKEFTSFDAYVKVMKVILNEIKEITNINYCNKYNFLKGFKNYVFSVIPIFDETSGQKVQNVISLIPADKVLMQVVASLCQ